MAPSSWTCGSAQTAAGALVRSGQDSRNRLGAAVVREALLPGQSVEDLGGITLDILLVSGLRLRPDPEAVETLSPPEIQERAEELRREIEKVTRTPKLDRGRILDHRLPRDMLTQAGADSGLDAVRQAVELWRDLDETSKSTLAVALLMHRASYPRSWPTAFTVVRYALDPDTDRLPSLP
jgi:hypothetical protein